MSIQNLQNEIEFEQNVTIHDKEKTLQRTLQNSLYWYYSLKEQVDRKCNS